MNKQFSKRDTVVIALILFSMFFGAGNLIFPPMVGKLAGTNMPVAMLFFGITAVFLPVLGMMAVAKTRGLPALGERVGKKFAVFFYRYNLHVDRPLSCNSAGRKRSV